MPLARRQSGRTDNSSSKTKASSGTIDDEVLIKDPVTSSHRKELSLPNMPFQCPECPFTVATRNSTSYLKQHQRMHEGKRQFMCNYCSYSSDHKHYTIKHEKIHSQSSAVASEISHLPEKAISLTECSKPHVLKKRLSKEVKIDGKNANDNEDSDVKTPRITRRTLSNISNSSLDSRRDTRNYELKKQDKKMLDTVKEENLLDVSVLDRILEEEMQKTDQNDNGRIKKESEDMEKPKPANARKRVRFAPLPEKHVAARMPMKKRRVETEGREGEAMRNRSTNFALAAFMAKAEQIDREMRKNAESEGESRREAENNVKSELEKETKIAEELDGSLSNIPTAGNGVTVDEVKSTVEMKGTEERVKKDEEEGKRENEKKKGTVAQLKKAKVVRKPRSKEIPMASSSSEGADKSETAEGIIVATPTKKNVSLTKKMVKKQKNDKTKDIPRAKKEAMKEKKRRLKNRLRTKKKKLEKKKACLRGIHVQISEVKNRHMRVTEETAAFEWRELNGGEDLLTWTTIHGYRRSLGLDVIAVKEEENGEGPKKETMLHSGSSSVYLSRSIHITKTNSSGLPEVLCRLERAQSPVFLNEDDEMNNNRSITTVPSRILSGGELLCL